MVDEQRGAVGHTADDAWFRWGELLVAALLALGASQPWLQARSRHGSASVSGIVIGGSSVVLVLLCAVGIGVTVSARAHVGAMRAAILSATFSVGAAASCTYAFADLSGRAAGIGADLVRAHYGRGLYLSFAAGIVGAALGGLELRRQRTP